MEAPKTQGTGDVQEAPARTGAATIATTGASAATSKKAPSTTAGETARAPGLRLVVAVILCGVAAGLGGAALSWLIHAIEQVAFGHSEAQVPIVTTGTTGAQRLMAVTVGGLVVAAGWALLQVWGRPVVGINAMVKAATPEQRRPPMLENVLHAVLQIVAVGSGAPIGREVAPRELGALFGGRIADACRLDDETRRMLVACGAAAGLAAVYHVPLAGAVFALEILLGCFTVRAAVMALSVSVIATLVARIEVSSETFYQVPQLDDPLQAVLWAALIGALLGVPGAAFRRAVQAVESKRATRWTVLWMLPLACVLTGALSIWLPQVLGNGRSAAQTAYWGTTLGVCAALLVGKTCVVLMTLRAGAFGGTLTPGLSLGALAGLLLGLLAQPWVPGVDLTVTTLAGSAAFLAVSMNAPLTGFCLVAGFTGQDSNAWLPLLAAVGCGMATSTWLPAGGRR